MDCSHSAHSFDQRNKTCALNDRDSSFTITWQTRNKEKISSYLDFINDSLPPLMELRVNWPFFPQLQQCANEILWSVYVSAVFIISLLPSLTLKVFCKMLRPVARRGEGEADGESQLCVNMIWKHTVHPSLMHFNQLTFADILWLHIYSCAYTAINLYCKYWGNVAEAGEQNSFVIMWSWLDESKLFRDRCLSSAIMVHTGWMLQSWAGRYEFNENKAAFYTYTLSNISFLPNIMSDDSSFAQNPTWHLLLQWFHHIFL